MDHDLYEEPARPPRDDPGWKNMLLAWEKDFLAGLDERGPPEKATACRHPIKKVIRSTLDWCVRHDLPLWDTKEKISEAAYLVIDLYEAVTNDQIEAPKLKARTVFWQHVRVGNFIARATPEEIKNSLHPEAVKAAANTYISKSWLQNPYLDWVFLETLILGENLLFLDHVMSVRHGISYAMYGFGWKAGLFRLGWRSVGFVLGWILPAVLMIWLADPYVLTAVWIGVAYYGLGVLMIAKAVIDKIHYRLREGAFPVRRLLETLHSMDVAYEQLAEELIHVPSLQKAVAAARDKGAVWPSQAYVILDSVVARSASGWDRG